MEYGNQITTPLKFHKLNQFFLLPFGIISCLFDLRNELLSISVLTWFHIIDFVYYLLVIALMLFTFWGFLGWKIYAYRCVIIYGWTMAVYSGISLLAHLLFLPNAAINIAPLLAIRCLYAAFLTNYYRARKSLFL